MKKKILLIPFVSIFLASCSKTNLLYDENAYNSPIFDENYYTNREDIDSLSLSNTTVLPVLWSSEDGLSTINSAGHNPENRPWLTYDDENHHQEEFGYHNNLSTIDESFSYGILSKLYDGRVRCEGYFQKSRVQLSDCGYATYFPKSLQTAHYFAFACRGATSLKEDLEYSSRFEPEFTPEGNPNPNYAKRALSVNFTISFYIHISNSEQYKKIVYNLNNVNIQVDNHGYTNLVYFSLLETELTGAVAMSFEWSSNDPRLVEKNLSTNYQDKEKDHLALMLYEVFIGESTWF